MPRHRDSDFYDEYSERDEYASTAGGRSRRDRGGRVAEYEEIDIRERRRAEPDFLREDYGRSEAGQLVVREKTEEVIGERRGTRERRTKDKHRDRGDRESTVFDSREELVIEKKEGPRSRRGGVEKEEIIYKHEEKRRPRARSSIGFEDEREVVIEKSGRKGRDIEYEREEEIIYRKDPRRLPVEREVETEEIIYRPRERSPPMIAREVEEFVYRQRETPPPRVVREHEEWGAYPPPRRETTDREEISISERRGPERPRGVEREDIVIRRDELERDRPRDRGGYEREEIQIRREEVERPRERDRGIERDDITIRHEEIGRDRPRERERGYDREEITIRRDEVDRDRPRERDRGYEREEIAIRRDVSETRSRYRGSDHGMEREEVIIRRDERERDRPRRGDFKEEDIIIRRDHEEGRRGDRGYRDEELIIRRDEREPERPRERDRGFRDEEVIIRRDERDGRDGRKESMREEIVIRRDREPEPEPEPVVIPEPEPIRAPPIVQEIITHHRHIDHGFMPAAPSPRRARSPSPKSNVDEIEIRRRGERNGKAYDEDIIIESRNKRETPPRRRSPSPQPSMKELEIRRRGERNGRAYEEDIIIDSRSRRASPLRRRSPSPKSKFDELEIRRRGERNGRAYDEDIIIDSRSRRASPPRRRSPSPKSVIDELEIRRRGERNGKAYEEDLIIDRRRTHSPARPSRTAEMSRYAPDDEADYYARRNAERAYMGEAYNGATRDWAIVDVPPGTSRVKLDGIGGASQEITWQRYNGVRRSNFLPEGVGEERGGGEVMRREEVVELDRGRRFMGVKNKTDNMWTEITKDLVVKEAIDGCGYDYEETEFFYYVMEYLRYEDVLRLVNISEDLRRDRKERIRQMEWEQTHPIERDRARLERDRPKAIAERPWDEERIIEREVVYDRPPPPPVERRREVRERTYVMR
ncbi:hypothetical protein MMC25_001593 [Agyrium rufum]|nr:hypothetical protein [Agyrium rufum]